MKRIITENTIKNHVTQILKSYQEELQSKLNKLSKYDELLKELEKDSLINVKGTREVLETYNSYVKYSIESYYDVNIHYNYLYIEDGKAKIKDVEYLIQALFEKVRFKYSKFIEDKNKIGIEDKSALYDNNSYWKYKVEDIIELLCRYYDLDIDINEIEVPTEVGVHPFNRFALKLQKNGKIYIIFK